MLKIKLVRGVFNVKKHSVGILKEILDAIIQYISRGIKAGVYPFPFAPFKEIPNKFTLEQGLSA